MTEFNAFMHAALDEARAAQTAGEVPIGAVIVKDNAILARGQNRTRRDNDPTAHAEVVAIRAAGREVENYRLDNCDLYVSLEPCAMCAGAIAEARIRRVYFAAEDEKSGGTLHGARVFEHPQCHHKPEVYAGIGENEANLLLRNFFVERRK